MERILSRVAEAESVSVQRSLKPEGFGDVSQYQMHHFADASERGYGTVSFLRMVSSDGHIHCSLLKGKSHLAPLKTVTIPRLELMAAVTAVRVSSMITDAVKFESPESAATEEVFWRDSTTVLRYIQNKTTRYHTFVDNRLSIIHDSTTPQQWRYVPSDQNPADDVTRGVQSDRWLNGPKLLLTLNEEHWPEMPPALEKVTEADPEVKNVKVCAITRTDEAVDAEHDPMKMLVDHFRTSMHCYEDWLGYFKFRLARILQVRYCLRTKTTSLPRRLEAQDLKEAEGLDIEWLQQRSFPLEYQALKKGQEVSRSSKINHLSPIISEGIIRVGGRLANASVTTEVGHPIVLPSKGSFTELVIREAHERTGYSGRQLVLADLRNRYWILKSSVVRRVLSQCPVCRRHRPPETQRMADLPADRVAFEPVFTNTGMDFFGPFYVTKNRGQVKRYGVIFTCLSVRAVHIEVAENLSADSFLCALRRFKARRVHVKTLRSDQGTNFVGASKELKRELQRLEESEELIHKRMLQ